MKIAILLSTFNGEKFLETQIISLINQKNNDWHLYIRDDGSLDKTVEIVKRFCIKHPSLISFIEDSLGNIGSAASFMALLSTVDADYYMFCDQDDFWLENKIQVSLDRLVYMEMVNPGKPCLVFTDLTLVNDKLELLHRSMWEYSKINPENAKDFYKNICRSSVTGCTIMMNNHLKKRVLPYPMVALMHDWWVSLNACHYGKVDYISEPTMLYRQHEKNVLGAEIRERNHYLKKVLFIKETIKGNVRVLKIFKELNFDVNYLMFFIQKVKVIFNIN
jgi:glycosyltransferase involved in cell wall biosynthesis